MLLINVCQFDGFSSGKCTCINSLETHNHAEEGGLTGSVRSNNTNDAVRWKHKVEILEQNFVAKSFCYMIGFEYLVAETRTIWNKDFQLLFTFFLLFVEHLIVAVQTRFALSLTCFWCHAYPFELTLQRLSTLRGSLLFLSHTCGFLVEPA